MATQKDTTGHDANRTLADMLEAAGYCNEDCTEFKPVLLEHNPFKRIFSAGGILDLLQWRLIRHEFMFPSHNEGQDDMVKGHWAQNTYRPKDPHMFHFYMYLDVKMGEAFVELIEVDAYTWFTMALAALLLPWVISLGEVWYSSVCAICSWSIVACMFLFGVHIHNVYTKLTPELTDPDPRKYIDSFRGTSAAALKSQYRHNQAQKRLGEMQREGSFHSLSSEASGAVSESSVPLLNDCDAPAEETAMPALASIGRGFSRRFDKKIHGDRSVESTVRPWFLRQLSRLGIVKLDKAAPNDHDRLFFFHEASPAIYMHFVGDLLFFQSVVTAMYMALYCFGCLSGPFEICMAFVGLSGFALNLFWLVPKVVGKTVIVTSIDHMKDKSAIETVILDVKKHQLLQSLKLFEIARLEGKVARIMQAEEENLRATQRGTSVKISESAKQRYAEIFENEFSAQKKKDIVHMFQVFDEDGSNTIEKEEMFAVFVSMNVEVDQTFTDCLNKLWQIVDSDRSGCIDYDEFCILIAMVLHKDEKAKKQDDEALFQKFDEDDSGEITIAELTAGFEKLGVDLDIDSIANLVGQVFKRSKQKLRQGDFVEFMKGLEEMSERAS